jgi:hypothetical protein
VSAWSSSLAPTYYRWPAHSSQSCTLLMRSRRQSHRTMRRLKDRRRRLLCAEALRTEGSCYGWTMAVLTCRSERVCGLLAWTRKQKRCASVLAHAFLRQADRLRIETGEEDGRSGLRCGHFSNDQPCYHIPKRFRRTGDKFKQQSDREPHSCRPTSKSDIATAKVIRAVKVPWCDNSDQRNARAL